MVNVSTLTTLLVIFGVVLLFNSLLSVGLNLLYKNKLYKISAFLWITTFVNFILQGIFQDKDMLTVLAFSTYFPTSILFVLFYKETIDSKTIKLNRYYIFGAICMVSSILSSLIHFNFIIAALFPAIAIAYPMLDISFKALKNFKSNNAVVNLFAITIFLNALHFIDYPFLRHNDDNAVVGFSIALLLLFASSIIIPSLSILKISNRYSLRLEKNVKKRTESLNKAMSQLQLAAVEIENKNADLKKKTIDNDALISILCHDLANPITVLKYKVEILSKGTKNSNLNEQQISSINKSQELVNNMIEILDDVRKMHSIRLGKLNLTLKPVNLNNLIKETLMLFSERIIEKNIKVNTDCTVSKLILKAEESTLKNQVFANIISNAIKFSHKGGEINISSTETDNEIKLSIQDFGIGIPSEMQKNIFSFKVATNRKGTDGERGTGFGFPIVKTCLELFGADIEVKSRTKEEYPDQDSGTQININFKKVA